MIYLVVTGARSDREFTLVDGWDEVEKLRRDNPGPGFVAYRRFQKTVGGKNYKGFVEIPHASIDTAINQGQTIPATAEPAATNLE